MSARTAMMRPGRPVTERGDHARGGGAGHLEAGDRRERVEDEARRAVLVERDLRVLVQVAAPCDQMIVQRVGGGEHRGLHSGVRCLVFGGTVIGEVVIGSSGARDSRSASLQGGACVGRQGFSSSRAGIQRRYHSNTLEYTSRMRETTFGFSPCPNDTFAFHALVHGLVDAPGPVRPVLLDIEELNRRAHHGEFDLTKLSVGAFAGVGERYRLLRSGAALGRGVGPLVVTRAVDAPPPSLAESVRGRVAIPGRETTAFRLLQLAAPALGTVVELRYDRILPAVASGDVDAGLIIHESRFTYASHGLVQGGRPRRVVGGRDGAAGAAGRYLCA